MAKREVLGYMPCPECDFERAEIKRQKCGVKLYRYCPECNAQAFARTEAQEKAMRRAIAKTGVPPVVVEAPKPAPAPDPEKPAEPKKAAPKAKAPAPEPKPAPEPAPVVKKSAFSDALGFLGVK